MNTIPAIQRLNSHLIRHTPKRFHSERINAGNIQKHLLDIHYNPKGISKETAISIQDMESYGASVFEQKGKLYLTLPNLDGKALLQEVDETGTYYAYSFLQ